MECCLVAKDNCSEEKVQTHPVSTNDAVCIGDLLPSYLTFKCGSPTHNERSPPFSVKQKRNVELVKSQNTRATVAHIATNRHRLT